MDTSPSRTIRDPERARARPTIKALHDAFGAHPFHVTDAASIGLAHDRVVRACAQGALHRLGRGWYAVAATQVTPAASVDSDLGSTRTEARLWVLHHQNPGVVACGSTAAAIWGLPRPPDVRRTSRRRSGTVAADMLEVAIVDGEGGLRGNRGDVLARRWRVPRDHVTRGPRGEPVTDPLRTAIDCARGYELALALGPLDAALRLVVSQGTSLAQARRSLRARCAEIAGGHGISAVARALAHADPLAESLLESVVRGRIIEAGLPTPYVQVPLIGASGKHYRVDMALDLPGDPECSYRLIIEADGLAKYVRAEDLAQEKRRQHDLERKGHTFVRALFGEALWTPAVFTDDIARYLGLRP